MLSGDGKENSLKISLSVIRRKNNFARGAHFVVHNSLPLFCTTTSRNFQKLFSYAFYGGKVVSFPVHFFFRCRSFSRWWPLKPAAKVLETLYRCQQYRIMLKTLRNNFKLEGEERSVLYLTDL